MAKAEAKRDYKLEYRRDQSSAKRRKYRAELQREARRRGIRGNTPEGKDLVHKNGKITGLGDRSANRADGARKATMAREKARRKNRKK